MVSNYNLLNAIPMAIFVAVSCSMSYWHGISKHGYGIGGLMFTILLGFIGQLLVVFYPIFL